MNHRQMVIASAFAFLLPATLSADPGVNDGGFFAQVDGTVALLNDVPRRNALAPGVGYNGRAGWRWDRFGLFAQVGESAWFGTDVDATFVPGVVNAGVGVEYRFLDDNARSSLAGGTSTLLFDAALDPAGTTGWFASLRPIGLRWPIADGVVVELHPFTFTIMQPVVTPPERLTRVEYQTVLALELQ